MDSEKNHDAKDTTINNEETDTKNGKLEVTNLEKVATELDTPLKTPPAKATFPLIIGVFAAVTGYSFQYGYNVAVINAPAQEIKGFFFPVPDDIVTCTNFYANMSLEMNYDISKKECDEMAENFDFSRDNLYAIAVSSFAVAGMVGSLLVGLTVGFFGRLRGLMAINVLSVIAAILMGMSKTTKNFTLLVVGRAFIGLFAGLGSGLVPIYIGEISPKVWRGVVGVFVQLQIAVGVLVAQILGLSSILGSDQLWPLLLSFTCSMSVLAWICYPFMVKSPRSLLIDKKNEAEATKVLSRLRGVNDVTAEIEEMKAEAAAQAAEGQLSLRQFIREKNVRIQMITVALLMAAQNCSGINAIFFYSNSIFEQAGIQNGLPQDLASISIGATFAIMVVVTAFVIEKFGRRPLLQWGFGTMAGWCMAMALVLKFANKYKEKIWISYLSIVCLFGYMISFAIGPGPIPWILSAELFRQAARPPALTVSCLFNWGGNFLVGLTFPAVAALTGPFVFVGFMLASALTTMYVTAVLPETKGKTFQEITLLFTKINGIAPQSEDDFKEKSDRQGSLWQQSSYRDKPLFSRGEIENIAAIFEISKSFSHSMSELDENKAIEKNAGTEFSRSSPVGLLQDTSPSSSENQS